MTIAPRHRRPPPAPGRGKGETAREEIAEFVRCADRQQATEDTAALVIGRMQLDQRLADIDAEHVRRADDEQHGKAERHRLRQAEDDRREPEHGHRQQHLRPDIGLERPETEPQGGERRANRRGHRQLRQAGFAYLQDVAGVDQEKRGRPGEKDREQVERDRAEHHLVPHHVTQALDHLVDRPPVRARGLRHPADEGQRDQRTCEQPERHEIGQGRENGVGVATDSRAYDHPYLPGYARQRDGIGKDGLRVPDFRGRVRTGRGR